MNALTPKVLNTRGLSNPFMLNFKAKKLLRAPSVEVQAPCLVGSALSGPALLKGAGPQGPCSLLVWFACLPMCKTHTFAVRVSLQRERALRYGYLEVMISPHCWLGAPRQLTCTFPQAVALHCPSSCQASPLPKARCGILCGRLSS